MRNRLARPTLDALLLSCLMAWPAWVGAADPPGPTPANEPPPSPLPSTTSAMATPAKDPARVLVWADPATGVYHCAGTSRFGRAGRGSAITQGEARSKNFKPAFGIDCRDLPPRPATVLGTHAPAVAGASCGTERWPVKTLTDDDRGNIRFDAPVDVTVGDLVAIPRPDSQPPQSNRIEPTELTVFKVRARLVLIKKEKDSDFHLVLADPDDPETTMIAEVPKETCAQGSHHEAEFKALQAKLRPLLGSNVDKLVSIEGVGFFDFLHNQTGVAKNGIELHPVLSITFLDAGGPQ